MRILRIAQKIYPDVKGGGPYHVHAMSRDQSAMGHDVTVLTVIQSRDQPKYENRDGYEIIRFPSLVEPFGNAISVELARYLRLAEEFDVMHAHSHLYFSTNLAAIARYLGDTPLAITNHGLFSQTAPEWLFSGYLRTLGKWTLNSADIVFCYTENERERLRRWNVDTRTAVVNNGIDTERFVPYGPDHDSVTGDPALVFVGRLVDGKRPQDTLEAFDSVLEDYPDATLTFCGTGPLRDELETQAQTLGIENAVRFLGHLPYDEMPSVYRAADALLLSSRAEGLPRTVLEAMACDTPVVVSDLEQIEPVVRGAGQTFSVGDVDDFSGAIREVLRDAETYAPREYVVEKHDWSATVEKTTRKLQSL